MTFSEPSSSPMLMAETADLQAMLRRSDDRLLLEDQRFESQTFRELVLAGEPERPLCVRNVAFIGGGTKQGAALISGSAQLSNVVFSDFDCGEELRIDAEATLDEVVFEGARPGRLWIGPSMDSEDASCRQVRHARYGLDISKFRGEVVITGIPTKRVRIDPDRHIQVLRSRFEGVDWAKFGLDPFSLPRLSVRKLENQRVDEGIFSLPPPSSSHFLEAKAAWERLRAGGLLSPLH